ncbi:hypothetical protein Thimo_3210 [Thioflavicoccus mobilis 8321]|uniref:Uncharacterized protein n=1 Tax=Thioflavicoccus mobilis 8321 TaxID=765912 RepID=L0H2L1_9GAMM|nr:hypothetical protein Thimo_3210 [Thioflavicoccus mobilis 8321]
MTPDGTKSPAVSEGSTGQGGFNIAYCPDCFFRSLIKKASTGGIGASRKDAAWRVCLVANLLARSLTRWDGVQLAAAAVDARSGGRAGGFP